MANLTTVSKKPPARNTPEYRDYVREKFRNAPWWIAGIVIIAVFTAIVIITNEEFNKAFLFIKEGLKVTITTTIVAFMIALFLGLITGLGRISNNTFFRNLASFYVEIIRGIPMLVLIFFIALVGVPAFMNGLNAFGGWLIKINVPLVGNWFVHMQKDAIPMNIRAIVALSVTYGAFLAEVFRAGIQSIGRGQMEAARSQGMNYWQAMRYIILPQAIRNVLPALGNDFISMLKDTSLVSVLAVRDITQISKLYAGRTFQYQEAYITLAVLYLTMTVLLSFLMKFIEKRIHKNEQH